jgi:hypothetical protein
MVQVGAVLIDNVAMPTAATPAIIWLAPQREIRGGENCYSREAMHDRSPDLVAPLSYTRILGGFARTPANRGP